MSEEELRNLRQIATKTLSALELNRGLSFISGLDVLANGALHLLADREAAEERIREAEATAKELAEIEGNNDWCAGQRLAANAILETIRGKPSKEPA